MTKQYLTLNYASRLQNIRNLDSLSKQSLLRSIADDITAAFIRISKHVEKGTLSEEHTAPINDVIEIITGTETSQRRRLERNAKRYARLAKRLRGEREWMRREFGALVKRAETLNDRWKERVATLREMNCGMRRELMMMSRECEMFKMRMDGQPEAETVKPEAEKAELGEEEEEEEA